jgi:hypothetical protein
MNGEPEYIAEKSNRFGDMHLRGTRFGNMLLHRTVIHNKSFHVKSIKY